MRDLVFLEETKTAGVGGGGVASTTSALRGMLYSADGFGVIRVSPNYNHGKHSRVPAWG